MKRENGWDRNVELRGIQRKDEGAMTHHLETKGLVSSLQIEKNKRCPMWVDNIPPGSHCLSNKKVTVLNHRIPP